MAFEGLYRAQSAWDEAMAYYAVKAAEKEKRKMVVLAGSGHLLYNLGINRRVYERMQKPFKTVICVIVPEDKEKVEVSRSAAHYIWGLPEEERPAYPSVGLSVRTFDGLENLVIDRDPIDGAAKGQDFKKGDVILSVDGKSFADINEMRIYLSRFTWDDKVKFRLLREAKEKEVFLKLKETEADSSSGK
jgi:C-terminal processing protease CtpA/Prc